MTSNFPRPRTISHDLPAPPQLFAAAFAPGAALGADAAALRATLAAAIAPLLRNLPWGSDAAMRGPRPVPPRPARSLVRPPPIARQACSHQARSAALPLVPPLDRYAMAAARLGNASLAASILADPEGLWTTHFAPSGHYASSFLPVYTPANGALLAAVAFLAGGWDGDGGAAAPGFPRDGSWTVRAEGFLKYF